jgi:hypothetical protein
VWLDSLSSAIAIFGHQDYVSISAKDEDKLFESVMSVPKALTMLGTSKIEALVSAAESGGAVSVIAESCGPRGGPPPHIHTRED